MNRRLSSWTVLGVVAILALAAGAYFAWEGHGPTGGTASAPDTLPLFALVLPDAEGNEQSLGQWRGRVLIVNFWATWCEPCRDEMPLFVKAQQAYGGRGLQFVGIAIDQGDKVRRFAADIGLNYPALIGGYGAIELSRTFGNRLGALPYSLIIDRSGRIVHTQLGPLKEAQLDAFIAQLL
jgi:thiol-disulfide isomerase/thioredoxin